MITALIKVSKLNGNHHSIGLIIYRINSLKNRQGRSHLVIVETLTFASLAIKSFVSNWTPLYRILTAIYKERCNACYVIIYVGIDDVARWWPVCGCTRLEKNSL